MKSLSLTARLSLLLSLTVMVILSLCGVALYHSLAAQIGVRDDGALLTRVDQIRTLLHDEDAVTLIQQKPRLFANMLGNTESLLVLRFPGQPPLIVVNPGQRQIPAITPVAANQPLSLGAVQHQQAADGTPFIAMAALSTTRDGSGQIEIISGRLMYDRTQTLRHYRDQIVIATGLAMLLVAAIGAMLLQRGLRPLRRLAAETRAVDVRHLSHRIRMHHTPSELQPLVAAFNQMLSRLESGYQQLSQLTADMAHDLRTPINTLIGQTEVALNQPRSVADYQQLLGSNYEELERLAKMIDNMLFLAKAEDASQALDLKKIDLITLGERLRGYFEDIADDQQMTLNIVMQGEVIADEQLLQRALANLIANALRYGDRHSEIRIYNQVQSQSMQLVVENQGPQLTPAEQQRLFDRFWRADPARHQGSSGLGLSIVRSIMQLHQGNCEVMSEQGKNRFSLIFPCSS